MACQFRRRRRRKTAILIMMMLQRTVVRSFGASFTTPTTTAVQSGSIGSKRSVVGKLVDRTSISTSLLSTESDTIFKNSRNRNLAHRWCMSSSSSSSDTNKNGNTNTYPNDNFQSTKDDNNNNNNNKQGTTALVWLRTCLRISDNEALSKAASLGRDGLSIVFTWERGTIPTTPSAVFECAAAHQLDRTLRERYGHHLTILSTTDDEDDDENAVTAVAAVCSVIKRLKPDTVVVDASSSENIGAVHDLQRALMEIDNDASTAAVTSSVNLVSITDDGTLMPFSMVANALGRSRQGGRVFRWATFLSNMSKNFDSGVSSLLPCPAPLALPPPLDSSSSPEHSSDSSSSLPLPTAAGPWAELLMGQWCEVSEEEALKRATTMAVRSDEDDSNDDDDPVETSTTTRTTMKLGNRAATNKSTILSPYLRWGLISPRQAYHAGGVRHRDLLWRDWSHACYRTVGPLRRGDPVLPVLDKCYQSAVLKHKNVFLLFENEESRFVAWCLGRTGAPIVDAGMRQLWYEGWMPRNIRLLVASCLVEGLGLDWRKGRDWFEYTLVDHDPAINELMWQNAGFCGLDTFYKGLPWEEKEEECSTMVEEEEYVKRWTSREMIWPSALSCKARELRMPAYVDVVEAANACRQELKRGGYYKAAARVANTGVRVAWKNLESGVNEVPVGEVWGLGRVPIDRVSFDLRQTSGEDVSLAGD